MPGIDSNMTLRTRLIQSDNAVHGANIGVFEYDLRTKTVAVSDIWRKLLEIGPDERLDLQEEWRRRVHPDDLSIALEPIRICSEGEGETASCEYRLKSRDGGHWLWMQTDIAVAKRDRKGQPCRLVGAQTNITARKETEEALRVSVEQFRSAFHNAPIGKAIVALDGSHRMVNSALCSVLGYSEAELLQLDFQTITHPDDLDHDLSELSRLVEGQISSYTIQKRYKRANGSIMWGQLSVGLVNDSKGKPDHIVAQVVDITEQRQIDELRSQFVSVVSHELRTPLTSVLGALSLLELSDDPSISDEVQRLLFIAKTNGERLHVLIDDILDFQKFSAKQLSLSLTPHNLAGLLEECLLASLVLAERNGIGIGALPLDRTLVAMLDPKLFQRAMANLLSNAMKFADPGSKVEVSTGREGAMLKVSVTNKGPGIPDSFRDRVFSPFSQASSSSVRNPGGTGLGLSITKQMVKQMGGNIGFDSQEGGLTTFWFTLPAA